MSEDNNSNQSRRYPHNFQGLLHFAIDATKSEDAPNISSFSEMDPERRRFLEEALKSMTVDVVSEMQRICTILVSCDADENEKMDAITDLGDYVECLDTANDFCKIGGLPVLMKCLNSDLAKLREYTARTIGAMSQNNPFCQKEFLDNNFLPKLIELINDPDVGAKALYGISGIIRAYEPATANFIEIGGLECLLACLSCGVEKICTQSLFTLNAMITEHPMIRYELMKLEILPKLMPLFKHTTKEYNLMIETVCALLNNITEIPEACQLCKEKADLNVVGLVENVIALQKNDPSSEETIEFCRSILRKIDDTQNDLTDR